MPIYSILDIGLNWAACVKLSRISSMTTEWEEHIAPKGIVVVIRHQLR